MASHYLKHGGTRVSVLEFDHWISLYNTDLGPIPHVEFVASDCFTFLSLFAVNLCPKDPWRDDLQERKGIFTSGIGGLT